MTADRTAVSLLWPAVLAAVAVALAGLLAASDLPLAAALCGGVAAAAGVAVGRIQASRARPSTTPSTTTTVEATATPAPTPAASLATVVADATAVVQAPDGIVLERYLPPGAESGDGPDTVLQLALPAVGRSLVATLSPEDANQLTGALHQVLHPGPDGASVVSVTCTIVPPATASVPAAVATVSPGADPPSELTTMLVRPRPADSLADDTDADSPGYTFEYRLAAESADRVRVSVRDVTAWRRTEEALMRGRDRALANAERAGVYVAHVSHDLRTPLTGILGMTDLVLETVTDAEQHELLLSVRQSCEALLELVTNVLDLTRIRAGRVELQQVEFNLRESLYDFVEPLVIRAEEKGVEVVLDVDSDVPQVLVGDAGRLRQVVSNLVGNAIKFTEEGEVVLAVRPGRRIGTDMELRFTVTDTGIGISTDRLADVFDPFVQASTAQRYGGTGLGLAIARQLVELMNGTIGVRSESGKGSTFRFTVMLGTRRGHTSKLLPARPERLNDVPVLIVDARVNSRQMLESLMSEWGLRPTGAPDGHSALQELDQGLKLGDPHDLLLLDGRLPDMDSFSFLQAALSRNQRLRAVLLVSRGRRGDGERCRELGVAAYLTKPVKPSLLRRALLSSLGATAGTPVAAGQALITRHTLREASLGRSLTLLLAEDNAVNRKLITRMLERRGHRLVVAHDGREAVAAATVHRFDAILMDVQMPAMDGFEATAEIRRKEAERGDGTHTPILGLTAFAMKSDRARCLEAGMDDYIAKPVRPPDLMEKLASLTAPAEFSDDSVSVLLAAESGERHVGRSLAQAQDTGSLVDIRVALESVEGDRDLLTELLQDTARALPGWLERLRLAAGAGNLPELERSAHSLKGVLGTFSPRCADMARRVETLARATDREAAGQAAIELGDALDRLQQALDDAIGDHAEQRSDSP
ncbi:MAG: response regulator [Planctomycetota bacterium]